LAAVLAVVLDGMTTPLMVVDQNLRVVAANRNARQLTVSGSPMLSDGSLALGAATARMMRRAVREVADSRTNGSDGSLRSVPLQRGENGPALLQVRPVRQNPVEDDPKHPLVLVALVDPEPHTGVRPEVLQRMFDLTPAESDVFRAVIRGDRPAEIAQQRGAS